MFGGWLRTKKNVRYLDAACMAGWNWEKKHSLRLFYLEGRKRVEHSSGILDFWRVTWGTGVCPIWSADGKPKRARRCWKTCCFRIENWQCTGKYQREKENIRSWKTTGKIFYLINYMHRAREITSLQDDFYLVPCVDRW